MLLMLEDYLTLLKALHDQLGRTIEGLPVAALDWSPGPDMNSLNVLIAHTAGAERYLIGDVVGRDPSGRDRDAEFRARGLDAATLSARLGAALEHSRAVLEHLTGLIERITFHNAETGFAVMQVKVRGKHDLVPVLGTLPEVTAGEWIDAQGQWCIDQQYR